MFISLRKIINSYDPNSPLAEASTIPSSWYTDEHVFKLEKETVFSRSWHFAARVDQLREPGNYVTTEIAEEPIVLMRGGDNILRGFFNVCRHHAVAVMTEPEGRAQQMRCPYHGWTYSLEGELKGTPDFSEVCNFDRTGNGLLPVEIAIWEKWGFARIGREPSAINESRNQIDSVVEKDLSIQFQNLKLADLQWLERRRYMLHCNWKVF